MRAMPLLMSVILLWAIWPVCAQEPEPRPPVELILTPGEASAVPLTKGVAYANGKTSSKQELGKDSKGNDWKTVGYWASLRASSPLPTDDGFNHLRISHLDPIAVPGGQYVVFAVQSKESSAFDELDIDLVSLDGGSRRRLLHGGIPFRVLPTGHLLFARGRNVRASSRRTSLRLPASMESASAPPRFATATEEMVAVGGSFSR